MIHTKKALLAVLAVAVGGFAVPAQAAFITGGISFNGFDQAPTCSGTPCTAGNLTGVDFLVNAPTLNAAAGSAYGDFSGITQAAFNDITLAVPGTIWTAGGFSFAFLSSSLDSFSGSAYTIRFSGVVSGSGFDPTEGTLVFTGNQAGSGATASWSASQAVPVPASAALLGIGLLGVAGMARRRRTV